MTEMVPVSEAEILAVFDGEADLVVRPVQAPQWVLPGVVPWEQRRRRRVLRVQPSPDAAWVVHTVMWSVCGMWGLPAVAQTASACASGLVAHAALHATWPDGEADRVEVAVSVAGQCLVVEVCDPDPHWPAPSKPVHWDELDLAASTGSETGPDLTKAMARVTASGGTVGCVANARGKNVFFLLPLAQDTEEPEAQQAGGAL